MPELGFLRDIVILLAMALAAAWLFSRLRLSPIIGYLATGVLAGPHGLHLIKAAHVVEVMAEVGVIMLLFTIGLEFSFSRILRLKRLMLISGTTQLLLTGALIFAGARLLGLDSAAAWTLAMALAVSSTAIVLKLLLEGGEIDTAHGRVSLAILIFQDLAVVFFLVGLPLLGGGAGDFTLTGLSQAALLLGGLLLFSRFGLQPLLRGVLKARSPELFRLTVLVLVLATAWVTAEAGLSLALGAFLAGLALAESPYAYQALGDILPFRDTFLSVFFVSIGMLVDLHLVADSWPLILGVCLVLSLIKAFAAGGAALLSAYPLRIAVLCGLLLFQVGEFSFILLKQALALNLLPESVYQTTLAVIALTMVATPLLARHAPALAAALATRFGWRNEPELREETGNLEGHVIIAGYGLSGRNLGKVLREMRIPYLHIELNGELVRQGRQAGDFILYGDATSPAVLEGAGLGRARALVLAINDPSALARAIRTAREHHPGLYILARTRFVGELDYLTALGADEVIPDEFESSLQLTAVLLRRFGLAEGRILQLLATLRREHYQKFRRVEEIPPDLAGYLSVLEGGRIEFQAVPADSPCLGQSLADLAFRSHTGATVVGVVRHERTIYSPEASLRLEQGDTLMLLGTEDNLNRARHLLHGQDLT